MRLPSQKRPPGWYLVLMLAVLQPAILAAHKWAAGGTALWMPAAGVILAALVLYGPRMAPLVGGAAMVASGFQTGSPLPLALRLAILMVLTASQALAASALRAAGINVRLRRLRSATILALFTGLGALVAAAGTMGLLLLWHPNFASGSWQEAQYWFVGLAGGTLAVAPLFLVVGSWLMSRQSPLEVVLPPELRNLSAKHGLVASTYAAELIVLIGVFGVAARLAVGSAPGSPLYYPLFIPLVWAVLRFGVAGTAAGVTVGTCAVSIILDRGGIPFAEVNRLEIFLAVFSVAGVCFGAAQSERQDAQRALEASRAALAESEERLRLLIEGNNDYAIFMMGPEGEVLTWNNGAEALSGYRPEEIIGRNVSVLDPGGEGGTALRTDLARAEADGRHVQETWQVRKDGSRYWANVLITAMRDGRGRLRGYSGVVLDLTERRAAEQRLEALAWRDPLTGLANRSRLEERLEATLSRADGSGVGVLFADLDGFKEINDHWGHEAGDQVLTVIGKRLTAVLRPSDIAARMGGDEFVIMCDRLNHRDDLRLVAKRVAAAIEAPIEIDGRTLKVGASIGVAEAERGLSAAELISRADQSMYVAKGSRSRARRPAIAG